MTLISTNERLAISAAEAAELLGTSRKCVHDCITNGSLRSTKRGGRRFISGDQIREFLDDTPSTTPAV